MNWFKFTKSSLVFASRIVLGSLIVWWVLDYIDDPRKLWGLITVIIVSESDFDRIRTTAFARVVNSITGCGLGLLCIYIGGVNVWALMAAIALSVLIGISFKNYPHSWKLAPVTAAIVMVPAILEKAPWNEVMTIAFARTAEILFGTAVAFAMGMIFTYADKWIRTARKPKLP